MVNLHLGCGSKYIPGFIHIDLSDYNHIDYVHDIRSLPMIDDDSVDLIYACHVLEYFDRAEVVNVLKEWMRVLIHGGILRLAMPDLEKLSTVYHYDRNINVLLGPIFGRWDTGNGIIYHRTVYDYDSIYKLLSSIGFINVRRWDWRQTIHNDYDDYSQAYLPWNGVVDDEYKSGTLISLNVECNKS